MKKSLTQKQKREAKECRIRVITRQIGIELRSLRLTLDNNEVHHVYSKCEQERETEEAWNQWCLWGVKVRGGNGWSGVTRTLLLNIFNIVIQNYLLNLILIYYLYKKTFIFTFNDLLL